MMKDRNRRPLPLAALLAIYADDGIPSLEWLRTFTDFGGRIQAIEDAHRRLATETFLDQATDSEFSDALERFYRGCVHPPLHSASLKRHAGIIRHALEHFLRSPDSAVQKLTRCLEASGSYQVPGLGPSFWSAVLQATEPEKFAAWTIAIEEGVGRVVGHEAPVLSPRDRYGRIARAYSSARAIHPDLTTLHLDHFFALVGQMRHRDLWGGQKPRCRDAGSTVPRPTNPAKSALANGIQEAIASVRARLPLRRRLKERGTTLERAVRALETGLRTQDGMAIRAALETADPVAAQATRLDWQKRGLELALCVARVWEAEQPLEALRSFWETDLIPGAGLWLGAAVLHLRDALKYPCWNSAVRNGYATIDDAVQPTDPAERYDLFCAGCRALVDSYRIHPFEIADVLAALAPVRLSDRSADLEDTRFFGFCSDTFQFLEELRSNNSLLWMQNQRDRYRFSVRSPIVELCRTVADRFVEPVFRRQFRWDLETEARTGRAITSICKNDYGRSRPYYDCLWILFHRRRQAIGETRQPEEDKHGADALVGRSDRKRDELQFFVRLDAEGLAYGLRLGKGATKALRCLRENLVQNGPALFRTLSAKNVFAACHFGNDPDWGSASTIKDESHLYRWAAQDAPIAFKTLPRSSAQLRSGDLVNEITATFDALAPIYACALDPNGGNVLCQYMTGSVETASYDEADFRRATYLEAGWLSKARELLRLKRQLILQGVPGTGKTYIARKLAELLTGGRPEAARLIQFHPAYTYEEFIEGIKVRSVEKDGRHDVTYPVEDGLLAVFANEALRQPNQPHVLIIDEINRGNLPRIFGELLYLLEYRDQSIILPYSRRRFWLPGNLYLIGTMNLADRSLTSLDQALRRRFSFLDMPADPNILSRWFEDNPPVTGCSFANGVVHSFRRLNERLSRELGTHCQVGHSYFMIPKLDQMKLTVVWHHHVLPLLREYFAAHPGRQLQEYGLAAFFPSERSAAPETYSASAGT